MNDRVVDFPGITKLPLKPERVIEGAMQQRFARVLIVGELSDGSPYFAASDPDGGTALWDMERARYALMKATDDAE